MLQTVNRYRIHPLLLPADRKVDALLKEPPAARISEHDVSNPKVAKRPRAKELIDESTEEDATEEEEEDEEEEASEDDYEMSSDEDLKSKKAQAQAKQQITR